VKPVHNTFNEGKNAQTSDATIYSKPDTNYTVASISNLSSHTVWLTHYQSFLSPARPLDVTAMAFLSINC